MESLSDLLKQLPQNSVLKQGEAKAKDLLQDPLVQQFRQEHPEIDDHTIQINLNRLYQYVKEYKSCSNCPGLDLCPNDFEGHYTLLNVESLNGTIYIHDDKVSCKKLRAKQTQTAIQSRIHSFYVDEAALRRGYSSEEIFNKDSERVEVVGQFIDYIIKTKEEGLQSRGLYLTGPFGTGKTFLMCYMLHELAKVGLSGVIIYMPDFVEDLKSMFQEPQKLKETIDLLKETDLLVFDDIGAENLNPWLRDHVMGAILNYRMNRKPTFYTSNYSLDDLVKHFSFTDKDGDNEYKGQRIMDRIRPFVDELVVNGFNKRGSHKK